MSHPANTILYDSLREWLEEREREVSDIFSDDRGAFIWDFDDFSPEQIEMKKIYLPDNLQNLCFV